ncbi:hypothetical protein ANCDUO_08523 [Ancylostoma duodenale]|uniref:Uncharacterized protein n=1 Tax=Ancylostoma duodenale TaxID=51022 RepID=A0A0C2GQ45_9BILA|nr:hypothetical protein ANCDUO_08523 [Ancylostoma duodenale]
MNITVDGRRQRGRPKTRWLDRIEEDMRVMKLTKKTHSIEGNGATKRDTPTPALGNMARRKKKVSRNKSMNLIVSITGRIF